LEVGSVEIGVRDRRTAAVEGTTTPRGQIGAGVSAVLCGAALIAYVVVFGAWVASTRVNIDGDPAAQPAKLAEQLVNGAATPMWVLYLALAVVAVLTVGAATAMARRLGSAAAGALGTAALTVLAITFLATAAVTQKAGSPVLPERTLVQAVPTLFGVVLPSLLGAFCLLGTGWTLTVCWIGWRQRRAPRWLSIVSALTGLALLAGISGAPGVEVAIAPWLICAGAWLLRA
jgi:hypothetical protein